MIVGRVGNPPIVVGLPARPIDYPASIGSTLQVRQGRRVCRLREVGWYRWGASQIDGRAGAG